MVLHVIPCSIARRSFDATPYRVLAGILSQVRHGHLEYNLYLSVL